MPFVTPLKHVETGLAQGMLTSCVMPAENDHKRPLVRSEERVVRTFLRPQFSVALAPRSKTLEVQVRVADVAPPLQLVAVATH